MLALFRFAPLLGVLVLAQGANAAERLEYPHAKKGDQIDNYHGTSVEDPYRWMEDEASPETRAWIEAENKLTFDYLEKIPERKKIRARLTQLWNYERYGVPFKEGNRYFFTRNNGLQNQDVLYTVDSLEGTPRMVLDPNLLSTDGTASLGGVAVSHDGKLAAYGVALAGSDWQEWKVRDIDSGKDLADRLQWVKFSGASWSHDNQGIYYSRYAEPIAGQALKGANYFQKLYYHRLGQEQSADRLVYERPDQKEWGFHGAVTDDGHNLVISISQGTDTRSRIYYQDLTRTNAPVVPLLDDFDAEYSFIDNDGPLFWFRTDLDAPRGKVIAIDLRQPERTHWKEIIPQSDEALKGISMVNDQFIVSSLQDAHSRARVFSREGKSLGEIKLPGLGSAGGFDGKRRDTESFYSFASFTTPGTIYRYDLQSRASSLFRKPKLGFDASPYKTDQVFYKSKDGARIPMYITHRRDFKLDGKNPTLLYGYGGFNISLAPSFAVANAAWLEMGGVYAMANLRGGGEYGEDWHKAGMKANKQNVFDDFLSAAAWLREHHYTEPARLGISGRSNGGLLVGASMTQHPELFAVALPGVGVMDMLRFQKFTIGWAWTSDYGSSDNEEDFAALYAYSPYHRLKPGTVYPSTLVTTADHDDRVFPAHSFKFAARLQECQAGDKPVLIRIETRAGHGAGKPTTKIIEETADQLAFLQQQLMKTPAKTGSAKPGGE